MQQTQAQSHRLTDDQRALVEQNLGLVGYVVNSYVHPGTGNAEDMFQEGALGLMKAAARYDSDRARFATFALHCIRNELIQAWRRESRKWSSGITVVSLDARPGAENSDSLYDALADDCPSVEEQVVDMDIVRRTLRMLNERPGMATVVVKAYLCEGLYQRTIADMYGYSQAQVSRLVKKTLDWLREELEGTEHDGIY